MDISRPLSDEAWEAAEAASSAGPTNPFATEQQIDALAPQNALVSGGATWNSGLTFDVTDLTYWLNGVLYMSTADSVTLGNADPTDPRIDIIAVDAAGTVSVIAGTPAPSPVKPELDLSVYVEVTFVKVAAGATTPTLTVEDIYLENVGGPAEWTATSNSANIVTNSSNDPFSGALSIEGGNAVNGNRVNFVPSSAYLINLTSVLEIKIKLKAAIGNNERFRMRFRNAGVNVGQNVDIRNGRFGFNASNTSSYQTISIPISQFQISGNVDELRIICNNIVTTIGFFIDNIRIQEGFSVNNGPINADDVLFTPSNAGNWGSIPANVAEALNYLAANLNSNALPTPYSTTAMFNIPSPGNGLTIFNTDLNTLAYWDSTKWVAINGEKIFNVNFNEDFESGSLATNGWVKIDGGENDFEIGTATSNGGTYSVYVSNDGGTSNLYSSLGGGLDVSHIYIERLLPTALTDVLIEFDWKCEGEVGFDYANVFSCATSVTPVANTELVDNGTTIQRIGQLEYNNQSVWKKERITLPFAQAGTNRRIVFSWRNDSIIENQPPIAIDNFKILFI